MDASLKAQLAFSMGFLKTTDALCCSAINFHDSGRQCGYCTENLKQTSVGIQEKEKNLNKNDNSLSGLFCPVRIELRNISLLVGRKEMQNIIKYE